MTQVMNRPGFGLTAPSSRQDVISALLNDYGNSFGNGDDSSYSPAFKELPPPPPDSTEKSAASLMTMRFQLRVDEPNPYDGRRKNSIESPTKITSRSISRNSKPPSLKLLASNGATAIVPPPPVPAASIKSQSPVVPASTSLLDRPLPPPPPEKSERRESVRRKEINMGHGVSKSGRRDSKDSQGPDNKQDPAQETPATKRKPLPGSGLTKKFASLADLKNGPRGRSVAPKQTTSTAETPVVIPRNTSQERAEGSGAVQSSVPSTQEQVRRPSVQSTQEQARKPSVPRSVDETSSRNALSGHRPTLSKASQQSGLPPTPDDLPSEKKDPMPPAPRKVYAGLPSNPRAKSRDATGSIGNIRDKSSTGFDMTKSSKSESNVVPTTSLNTITPERTPPPRLPEGPPKESAQAPTLASTIQAALKGGPPSPISPMSDYDSQRPFSFEKQNQQRQAQAAQQATAAPTSIQPISPVSPFGPAPALTQPQSQPHFPPRTTSRPEPQQQQQPQPQTQRRPLPSASQPPRQPQQPQQLQHSHQRTPSNAVPFPFPPSSPTSFTPLTQNPIPTRPQPITQKQLECYTHHATFSEYFSRFQRTGCMVCGQSERGVKCTCAWCCLQICKGCREELERIPGRDLGRLLERRREGGGGGGMGSRSASVQRGVIWEEEERADFT